MPATYPFRAIDAADIPRAAQPADQHVVDVYASEVNKTASVWHAFDAATLDFKPHPKSTTVSDIFKHELLSGRRFFGEFLGLPEPDAVAVVPEPITVEASVTRLADLARGRPPPPGPGLGGVVGGAGEVLRCRAFTGLGILASHPAQRPSPDAADRVSAPARPTRAADLRSDGRRAVDRRRSHADGRRGAPGIARKQCRTCDEACRQQSVSRCGFGK